MNAAYVTKRAVSLIKRLHGTTLGAVEFNGGWSPERVDAILFNGDSSFMIETKISRADFLADAKKPWRANPAKGVGRYRYYACPPGLIAPEELPPKWGLIYVPEGPREKCSMPVGYGGWIKTGERKGQYGWNEPIHDEYGTNVRKADGTFHHHSSKEHPRNFHDFTERCMKRELRYLYALATRYKYQKFMENIL